MAKRQKTISPELALWAKGQREHMEPNPMVRALGAGPDGARCKTCVHLRYLQFANRYYKCELRHNTHGPATDHRVGWRACARYREVTA